MSVLRIDERNVATLEDFYELMAETREVRFDAVNRIFDGGEVPASAATALKNALRSLKSIPEMEGKPVLKIDSKSLLAIDLGYETEELVRDILYLEEGESAFLQFLGDVHDDFDALVERGREQLGGRRYNCFITDRDGTINNYCGRYRSSIQSIYNAVMVTRFSADSVDNPIILTSAPLERIGLVDVSVNPERVMYYAASKGRECLDLEGRVRRFPIEPEKQAVVDKLNSQLSELVLDPMYKKFSLIGSGLQFKFGQTTVARQDITKSIVPEESEAFLGLIRALVAELDPKGENLRIEDTGLDVEIILTVENGGAKARDFDKGDGVRFLNSEFDFEMFHGPHLICGDTGSDVPMLEAAMDMCSDCFAVFVTRNEKLAERVRGVLPRALIVPEPDILVAILGTMNR